MLPHGAKGRGRELCPNLSISEKDAATTSREGDAPEAPMRNTPVGAATRTHPPVACLESPGKRPRKGAFRERIRCQ